VLRWSLIRSHRAFVPAIALFGAIVVSIAGVFGAVYEDQLYRAQKIDEVTTQARILAASVTAALTFNDNQAAQQYANAMSANSELNRVVIYDERGRVFAQFARRGAPPSLIRFDAETPVIMDGRVIVGVPVIETGQVIGRVYLGATMDSLERRFLKYGVIALIAAMAALLLIVLGTAQNTLSKINQKLQHQARDLAAANLTLQNEMRERAQVEEALRQSQKMEAVGQLSGGIAHDFNNFLMIIKGNLVLLQRRISQGRTDINRYVENAIEGVDRAVNVTQRVLAFSRRQPLSPESLRLSDVVRESLELVRQSVGGRINIETRLDADWWVYCDANQMENVILNLAINARDAMPDGGQLIFATRNLVVSERQQGTVDIEPGEYVELLVQDTGMGMTDEVRAKAFDPFFTTKPHGKGTGLGLSTTFGYIRQSAGYLDIESVVGRGTTIRILMPRHQSQSVSRSA
jgi:signal transduction histidine kinase